MGSKFHPDEEKVRGLFLRMSSWRAVHQWVVLSATHRTVEFRGSGPVVTTFFIGRSGRPDASEFGSDFEMPSTHSPKIQPPWEPNCCPNDACVSVRTRNGGGIPIQPSTDAVSRLRNPYSLPCCNKTIVLRHRVLRPAWRNKFDNRYFSKFSLLPQMFAIRLARSSSSIGPVSSRIPVSEPAAR